VNIQYKFRLPQGPRAQPKFPRDIERFEHGIDGDSITVANNVRERDGLTAYDDQLDFGVWYAEALDQVLNRARDEERFFECRESLALGKMVVQFGIEAEAGVAW